MVDLRAEGNTKTEEQDEPTIFQSVHLLHMIVHIGPLIGKDFPGSDLVQGLLEQVAHAPQLAFLILLALDTCSSGRAMRVPSFQSSQAPSKRA